MTTGDPAFDHVSNATPDDAGYIELPLIVTNKEVIFPQREQLIELSGSANLAVVNQIIEKPSTVLVAMRRDQDSKESLLNSIHIVGTEVSIRSRDEKKGTLLVQGRRRIQVEAIVQETPYPIARARVIYSLNDAPSRTSAQVRRIQRLLDQLREYDSELLITGDVFLSGIKDPNLLTDTIGSSLTILLPQERQMILEKISIRERLDLIVDLLQQEVQQNDLRLEAERALEESLARGQRDRIRRGQPMSSEIFEDDDIYQEDLDRIYDQIQSTPLPEQAREQAEREFRRLTMMNPMMPEAPVIHTYLDWLLNLPWEVQTEDNLDLVNAQTTLDENHYGLEKVKDRIIEHLAVRKLAQDKMKSPILCFVGPPGVGKTSLGQSIAAALGRKFVRISLGGVRDEAEIRGHRRTYIGALPGRIIQAMKRVGSMNPVFMLDEIDKLTEDYHGDPASALLEVLDPEQNDEFSDHYIEVPFDLSQVMFITTANELYNTPEALEDRMEIIEFRAYTEEEKVEIARQHLIPKQLEAHGISNRHIKFLEDSLVTIIRQYTMEAGVRNLEREIANVCRKIARMIATEKQYPKRLSSETISKLLGPPMILETRVNRDDLIGIATGLVWTSAGGDIQWIEVSLLAGKGNLTLTGQLGDVLQESAQTALSYMRSRAREFGIPYDDFEGYDIHIHMPEGSVPKDGPSAGITLAAAIISAFTERPLRSNFAMTGEITLRGHVLPIGGVKEKVLAARRNRIPNVILPAQNQKDLVEIPKYALKDLNIYFVSHMNEVLDLLLLDAPERRQRDIEAEEDEAAIEAAEIEAENRRKREKKGSKQ